jgi:hypothetical protein
MLDLLQGSIYRSGEAYPACSKCQETLSSSQEGGNHRQRHLLECLLARNTGVS